MPYASASHVEARLGRSLTPEESTLVETRLGDVERMIRKRITDLADKVEDDDYLADVAQVEAEAVLRLVRNPGGYYSETDGTYSYMFNRDLASGKLEITDEEWSILGVTPTGINVLTPRLVF